MSRSALQGFLAQHQAHAAMTFRLDEELGTLHGLSWDDFVLLELLESAGGAQPGPQLAGRLGLARSHFILRLLPLEKVGLVTRTAGDDGQRHVALRPPGRRLLREARETAAALCATLAQDLAPAAA